LQRTHPRKTLTRGMRGWKKLWLQQINRGFETEVSSSVKYIPNRRHRRTLQ
jgi:hypothetical protein